MRLGNLFIVLCCIAFAFLALAEDVTTTSASISASTLAPASETSSRTSSQAVSSTTAASSSDSAASATDSTGAISTNAHNATTSSIPTSTTTTNTTAPTVSSNPADGPTQDPNVLPLQPKITPALGIAGVVLIVLGGLYALIGIKNRQVHIFLSTAFLTGLGVLVLIVYVMHPPVQDAVQGGYFVAVFCTGVIFGGLALIFHEITEGLGCLLGGFCLSMWLLELKPGGLLTASGSKGALIGAISAGIYATSFNHYTRPYSLIGSTSFAGATAIVLGIDCFSQAGLKEFWLYLWGLNDDVFPLNTVTYPVTHGMKVEIALIMAICFLGLLSQFRLWKVIKERRKKQAMLQEEEEKKREEDEAELGRRLEEGNTRDRAIWESVYGNKNQHPSDSGISTDISNSPRKQSTTIETTEIRPDDDSGNEHQNCQDGNEKGSTAGNYPEQAEDSQVKDEVRDDPYHVSGEYVSELPGDFPPIHNQHPAVVPLPFNIPEPEGSSNYDDDKSVAATLAGSERVSRRLSGRLSRQPSFRSYESAVAFAAAKSDRSPASSVAGVPDEDDREFASEVGTALVDDEINDDKAAPVETDAPPDQEITHEKQMLEPTTEEQSDSNSQYSDKCKETDEDDHKARKKPDAADVLPAGKVLSLLPVTSPAPTSRPSVSEQDNKSHSHKDASKEPSQTASYDKSAQDRTRNAFLTADTVTQLPDRVSRVVSSYRTNEWAKHLSDAETPELEPIQPIAEESPLEDSSKEIVAPVHVDKLLQTPLNAQPPPAIQTSNDTDQLYASTNSRSLSDRSNSKSPRPASPEPIKKQTGSRRGSPELSPPPLIKLPKSRSNPSLESQHNGSLPGYRRYFSSQLLNNTLAKASIDESKEVDFRRQQYGKNPSLMAQREALIRSRVSSTSLSRDSWLHHSASASRQSLGLGISSSNMGSQHNLLDNEDMPLAQRRDMIHQQQRTPARNDATGVAWRESVRKDLARTAYPYSSPVFSRSEHDHARMVRQQQIMAASHIDQAIAQGMQRGELRDRHREAMRKMQAAANKPEH